MRKYGCATFKVKIGKKIEVKPDLVRYASRPAAGPPAQQQQNIHHNMRRSASESTSITKSTKPPATASLRRAPPAPRNQPQPKPYVNLQYGKSTAEHPIYEDESF